MKVSCDWLSDYLGTRPDTAGTAQAMTMAGFPVEHVERAGYDEVMDVEVTSNRPDLLSHIGVAREISAVMGMPFQMKHEPPAETVEAAERVTSVQIERLDLCPHYIARIIRGVKVGPSPEWLKRRLEAIGIRSHNNIVDVTNYVLMETGQPLHAFDLDKLAGMRIVVRTPRSGETLRTLDGTLRKLEPEMLCICDAEKPVALAGLMGGEDSEVTLRTKNILLESARFDPVNIRSTSRKLRLTSDASFRFERGLDPTLARSAASRACQLFLDTAGGTLLAGCAEAGEQGWSPRTLYMRFSALKRLLGIDLAPAEVVAALSRLGLSPIADREGIRVSVPSHRRDLNIEEDLIEEAARLIGYEKIPLRDAITITVQPPDESLKAMDVIRDALVGAGYFEAITFSFVSDKLREAFLPKGASLQRVDALTRKADAHLRPSILPGLLESLRHNENVGNGPVRLFEIGSVFYRTADGPAEQRHLGMAGGESYAACRGMLEALLAKLDADRDVKAVPAARVGFGRGACGQVFWGGEPIGFVGMLDRAAAELLDLRHLPAIAEVKLEALLDAYQAVPVMKPLSRFPALRRDVSLQVDEAVPYEQLESLVRELKLADLEALEHAATYRGKPLPEGQKSVTLTLVFRKAQGTLTREEADAAVSRVVQRAGERLGAKLRR